MLLALVVRKHPVNKGPDGPKPEPRVGHGEQLAGRAGQAASTCDCTERRICPGSGSPSGCSLLPTRALLNVAKQKWLDFVLVINILFYFSGFFISLSFILPCYLVLFSQLCFASLASLPGRIAAVHSSGLL